MVNSRIQHVVYGQEFRFSTTPAFLHLRIDRPTLKKPLKRCRTARLLSRQPTTVTPIAQVDTQSGV